VNFFCKIATTLPNTFTYELDFAKDCTEDTQIFVIVSNYLSKYDPDKKKSR
jgi:hypothetical protein